MLMEDLGDRQERMADDPGMKHEVSGLEDLKDLLRPCTGLDRLAEKQASFDCLCVFPLKCQTFSFVISVLISGWTQHQSLQTSYLF